MSYFTFLFYNNMAVLTTQICGFYKLFLDLFFPASARYTIKVPLPLPMGEPSAVRDDKKNNKFQSSEAIEI